MFPKSIVKLVKLLNINVLELWHTDYGCHEKYDLSWRGASKMNVFAKTNAIVEQLISLLSEDKYRKFPYILKQKKEYIPF